MTDEASGRSAAESSRSSAGLVLLLGIVRGTVFGPITPA